MTERNILKKQPFCSNLSNQRIIFSVASLRYKYLSCLFLCLFFLLLLLYHFMFVRINGIIILFVVSKMLLFVLREYASTKGNISFISNAELGTYVS